MKRYVCIALLLLSLLCENMVAQSSIHVGDSAKAVYTYMEAMRMKGEGRDGEAFDLLRHAIELDSTLAAAYSDIAPYYFQLNKIETGYKALLSAVQYEPDNYWYTFSAAEVARKIRDYDRAETLYAAMIAQKPTEIEVIERYADVCIQKEEPQKALDVYTRFENAYGATETSILQKARIYLLMNDRDKTYEEMERLIASNPRNTGYITLLGNLYLDAGRYDDAWNTYTRARATDSENAALQMALLAYYEKVNDREAYIVQLDTVLFYSDIDVSAKMSILPDVVQELIDDAPQLDNLLARLCELYPNELDLRKLYSNVLIHIGDYDRACDQLETALDINPDKDVWEQLFRILFVQDDFHKIEQVALRALNENNTELRYYLVAASTQMMLEEYEKAVQTLALCDSVPEIATDPLSRSEISCLLGDIRYNQSRREEAYAHYDEALRWNPKNYGVLNNYSYYLALEGRELDKAERMAGEAVKANPDNPTYLDTYAWVYFKQGRYSLARLYLKKAIDLAQEASAEMYEHYGDVLAVSDNIDEAVEWWKKAVGAGGDSEVLRRKIAGRKYISE
ncbi:MAG: tetratricopeptide repeat protein [Coprobacter sp.]|nr:tetratricopeptide repeat protein [Coprobacter sp.]